MLAMCQSLTAESLPELWAALHRTTALVVLDCEVHYLTATALAADDDLVAQLLLKKLRIARTKSADDLPADIVRMNSFVEFAHGGGSKRFCQLVHPSASATPSYGLSVTSLAGAGLIGLRAGQSILWPNAESHLSDLKIVHVENCPGISRWLESAT
jgi:regulator of nucleoside diphosphate kinase